MSAQAKGDTESSLKKERNISKFLIVIIFVASITGIVGLMFLYVHLDYQRYDDSKPFRSYVEDRLSGEDCEYYMSDGLIAFPIRLEADIKFIDENKILVSNPDGCKNKFEFVAEIGQFNKQVTQVFTPYGKTPEDASEIIRKGYPNATPYYIGDKEAYKRGQKDVEITDRGNLFELYGSAKEYSNNNALLNFYRLDRVYYNEDNIYVTKIFFNEK